jgi:hypothetical protein
MQQSIALLTVLTLGLATPLQADWWDEGEKIRGEGAVEEVERDLGTMDAVELATTGTLYITQGDSAKLTVVAEANLHEYIQTDIKRGVLVIRTERGVSLRPRKAIEYHLTVPELTEITISSSGDAVATDWTADRLFINLESSGDMEWGAVSCPDLEIRLESSGDLYIDSWEGEMLRARLGSSGDLKIGAGKTVEQEIEISSSGDYYADKLESKTASVRTSSSGDARVRVSEHLHARTSSSGDIVYYGRPELDMRSSSSGDIVAGGR